MLPNLISLFLYESILIINMIFIGKLNDEKILAGFGLANSLIICLPVTITIGVSNVLETFVSQSFGC